MPDGAAFHERFERAETGDGSSDRAFGLVFSALFAFIAVRPLLAGRGFRGWAAAVAVGLLLVALLRPALFAWPNRLWLRLGGAIGKVMSPVLLAVVFIAVVTPTALITRLLGRDPLRLRFDRDAATYWIERRAAGGDGIDLRKQF